MSTTDHLSTNANDRIEFYFEKLSSNSGATVKWSDLLADFSSESEGRINAALKLLTVSQLDSLAAGITAVRDDVKASTLQKLKLEAMKLGLNNQTVIEFFAGQPQVCGSSTTKKKTTTRKYHATGNRALKLPRSFVLYVSAIFPQMEAAEMISFVARHGIDISQQRVYQTRNEVKNGWLIAHSDFVSQFEAEYPHLVIAKPEVQSPQEIIEPQSQQDVDESQHQKVESMDAILEPDPIDDSMEELEAEEDSQLKYLGVQ